MLAHFTPASSTITAMLADCFVMVLAFEATNGFHDASNAVATVDLHECAEAGAGSHLIGLAQLRERAGGRHCRRLRPGRNPVA